MALSWNEIKARAIAFSKEWENETSENAEAKSFWDGFFHVFGVNRRRVASFELPVTKSDGKDGYIDLLWKGQMLVEHKSRGKDLTKASQQARDYFPGLKDHELPRYILVSDFARFRIYDLDEEIETEFLLSNLIDNVALFGFLAGYQKHTYRTQNPVNIQAAEKMAKLHDKLKENNYTGHELEVYLVRLLFLLFAEDTTIFEKDAFREYIELKTHEDGSDLAGHLAMIFDVCNTPIENRLKNLDESLADFRYINGKLFEERLAIAAFDMEMRELLLECCSLNWGLISPAIFGSLFQNVLDPLARRTLGAHYTSETNILKVIGPLFLDDLLKEFSKVRSNIPKLKQFHDKIASLRFLDPACGCGNFLVIAYRELRKIELAVLKELLKGQTILDIAYWVKVDVDQFYGIELEEFPAQIAQVALWLMDHQMNMICNQELGQYFVRLPLKKRANIVHGNALTMDWKQIVEPANLSYILGNPPFIGKQYQTVQQKLELAIVFNGIRNSGLLDYVGAWFIKAASYIQETGIHVGFVATNSITQGEQVGVLWKELLERYNVKIQFAHRTFRWSNEARGIAGVHCVIIGFGLEDPKDKILYDYESSDSEAQAIKVKNINPYLVATEPVWLEKRRSPVSPWAPPMKFGSMPNDGGFLILSEEVKNELIERDPRATRLIRRLMGSEESINNTNRWCLWLKDIPPNEFRHIPLIMERLNGVKITRLASKRATTRGLGNYPQLFGEDRQPDLDYLAVPEVSSENRHYIPIVFLKKEVIATNKLYTVSGASLFHFGVLTSAMHMAWTRAVCGRLESRYQYSTGIVFNNFPWPEPTLKLCTAIEALAQVVLDTRSKYPDASLADLYDPLSMPPELMKAHSRLDRAVDRAYGKVFASDTERVAHLFKLYLALVQ